MPRDGNVVARSGDGSIRIDHVRGRLELKTGDGSIRATDISGQLTLATGDGSVSLDDVAGGLGGDTRGRRVGRTGELATAEPAAGHDSSQVQAGHMAAV